MEQNIYLDVYFGFNFLMDFFVLFITGIIIKQNRCIWRMILASLIGSLYATIILLFDISGMLSMIFTYILVAYFMVRIAFRRTSIKSVVARIGILYLVTFVVSGIVNMTYYESLRNNSNTNYINIGDIPTMALNNASNSMSMIISVAILVCIFFWLFMDRLRNNIKRLSNIYQVRIIIGNNVIYANALYDTGNSLTEPMTGKPVSIIEESMMQNKGRDDLRLVIIPYNSVGKQHGLLEGFIADCMELNGQKIANCIIAIYKGKLNQNNQYNMILHPDILSEKGEVDAKGH